ncbi:hypothetical protein DIPPA_05089 [Diplonema papillatum]|nr:hypothetical protein DIPPA_05089 [Diplonema papillatum]
MAAIAHPNLTTGNGWLAHEEKKAEQLRAMLAALNRMLMYEKALAAEEEFQSNVLRMPEVGSPWGGGSGLVQAALGGYSAVVKQQARRRQRAKEKAKRYLKEMRTAFNDKLIRTSSSLHGTLDRYTSGRATDALRENRRDFTAHLHRATSQHLWRLQHRLVKSFGAVFEKAADDAAPPRSFGGFQQFFAARWPFPSGGGEGGGGGEDGGKPAARLSFFGAPRKPADFEAIGALAFPEARRALDTPSAGGDWNEIQPTAFPSAYAPYLHIYTRKTNLEHLPATRLEAFFPDTPLETMREILLDPAERLRWDRNLTAFFEPAAPAADDEASPQPAGGEGKVLFHAVENKTMNLFGFKGRSFLYRRLEEPCGDRCVDVRFRSVTDEAIEDQVSQDSRTPAKTTRGFIYYQHYRLQEESYADFTARSAGREAEHGEEEEDSPRGLSLTITAATDTGGTTPPRSVVNFMCKMLGGNPYIWMRQHLDRRAGVPVVGSLLTGDSDTLGYPASWATPVEYHFAMLE